MAKTIKARVLAITDGDTINISANKKTISLRLACIDAPELGQAPFGNAARDALTGLIPVGSTISYRPKGKDNFGRTIAEVFGARKSNIGLAMVETGQAFVYEEFVDTCDADLLINTQNRALQSGLGIWSATNLQKPWDYRKQSSDNQPGGTGGGSGSIIPPYTGERLITCSQISSRELAEQWLAAGHSYLDSDGDGCACESQFPC